MTLAFFFVQIRVKLVMCQIIDELEILQYNFTNNLLTLNLLKTKFMVFKSLRKIKPHFSRLHQLESNKLNHLNVW